MGDTTEESQDGDSTIGAALGPKLFKAMKIAIEGGGYVPRMRADLVAAKGKLSFRAKGVPRAVTAHSPRAK